MTNPPTAMGIQRLGEAVALLRARRPREAADALNQLVQLEPDYAEARRLLGIALMEIGDLAGSERELRAAIRLNGRTPAPHTNLGATLAATGRAEEAEAAYRDALALDPAFPLAVVQLSDLKMAAGAPGEALEITAHAAAAPGADVTVLTAHGEALKALGRLEEAVDTFARGTRVAPGNGVAEHNLACTLADSERFDEGEPAIQRAMDKGLDAPETWHVRGRILQGLSRFDEAEAAFRQAILRNPTLADAQGDLAQLIWMRTEDAGAACESLDTAIAADQEAWPLRLRKSKMLEYAGDRASAYGILADFARRPNADPMADVFASQLSVHLDGATALTHAERAFARLPDDLVVLSALCQANLTAGRADKAVAIAEVLRARAPLDQYAIALMSDAWRAAGDPRSGMLHDFNRLVDVSTVETPHGWSSLGAFLADLTVSLSSALTLRAHPVGQSLRFGAQTQRSLHHSRDPVIEALFQVIDEPIRRFIRALGPGDDPFRARATEGHGFNGTWAVRLRPNGYHANHLHPMGWISSAFYVAVPDAVDQGKEGWLKFGEPDAPASPALTPLHYVKPAPGRLVLFPSYMWHGTVPFTGDQPRLTAAFDLLPV